MAKAKTRSKGRKKARKKPTNAQKRIARPLTPEALADYGELTTPAPTGSFDPQGPWKHTYRIWMTGGAWDNYRGYLTLERLAPTKETFELKAIQALVVSRMRAIHETTVTMLCRDGSLATPLKWQLRSRFYDVKTKEEFSDATVEQVGTLSKGSIEISTNGRKGVTKAPAAWSSNWSIFEAVQRLPRTGMEPLTFGLLDDLDIMKPNHGLVCRDPEAVRFGNVETWVTRYDQIGQGCLPCRYYVDAQGRLLLAHTELRAYILDAKVLEAHDKKMQWLANKEMR